MLLMGWDVWGRMRCTVVGWEALLKWKKCNIRCFQCNDILLIGCCEWNEMLSVGWDALGRMRHSEWMRCSRWDEMFWMEWDTLSRTRCIRSNKKLKDTIKSTFKISRVAHKMLLSGWNALGGMRCSRWNEML